MIQVIATNLALPWSWAIIWISCSYGDITITHTHIYSIIYIYIYIFFFNWFNGCFISFDGRFDLFNGSSIAINAFFIAINRSAVAQVLSNFLPKYPTNIHINVHIHKERKEGNNSQMNTQAKEKIII